MPTKSFSEGSFPKSELKPVIKNGIRRINGRQVNLVIARGADSGLHGNKLLEFIEFECGFQVSKLEDIEDGPMMQAIVAKLRGDK